MKLDLKKNLLILKTAPKKPTIEVAIHGIKRALVAEKVNELLWEYFMTKNCPFPDQKGTGVCEEVGYACSECVHNNIYQLALTQLREEGIEID
jgi:hypothetical protein